LSQNNCHFFFEKAKIILDNTARHSRTRGAKGPRQNRVQQNSTSTTTANRSNNREENKTKQKKQAIKQTLSKL